MGSGDGSASSARKSQHIVASNNNINETCLLIIFLGKVKEGSMTSCDFTFCQMYHVSPLCIIYRVKLIVLVLFFTKINIKNYC